MREGGRERIEVETNKGGRKGRKVGERGEEKRSYLGSQKGALNFYCFANSHKVHLFFLLDLL